MVIDQEGEAGADMVAKRDACRVLMGKPDKKFLGSASLNWNDNIKVDLEYNDMLWTRFMWLGKGTVGGMLWIR